VGAGAVARPTRRTHATFAAGWNDRVVVVEWAESEARATLSPGATPSRAARRQTLCQERGEHDGVDYEHARVLWLRHGMAEVDLWCRHIAAKVREIIAIQQTGEQHPVIQQSEAIFDICAVLNRLVHIACRQAEPINGTDLTRWLSREAGWPLYVAKAFWYCVRNPTMHLGRAWMFADHDRKHEGMRLFADVASHWAVRGMEGFPDTGPGWWAIRGSGLGDGAEALDAVRVTFYMPGVLLTLGTLRNSVIEGLRAATDDDLKDLVAVNATTGFFTSDIDPSPTIAELDLSDVTI